METTTEQRQQQKMSFGVQYGVKLEVFEGPLDLLLFLIRRNEVDIYDIPIATITNEYLSILGEVHLLDLEPACDFMLMAATLMKIKSQLLLPREVTATGEEEEADPRAELVRRLLEYQQFKEIADWLGDQAFEQRDIFRNRPSAEIDAEGAELHPVSLFDLLKSYKHVIDHVPRSLVHRIIEEQVSVEQSIEMLLQELDRRGRLRFFDLISGKSRHSLVSTFIGVLELLKSQRIRVQQTRPFADIWIEPKDDLAGNSMMTKDLVEVAGPKISHPTENSASEPTALGEVTPAAADVSSPDDANHNLPLSADQASPPEPPPSYGAGDNSTDLDEPTSREGMESS